MKAFPLIMSNYGSVAIQSYKLMEKVLKLLQPKSPIRESPIKCEGIFDRKTYQHSFYKVSSTSSIEEMIATKFQRITLSQNSKKHKGHSYSVNAHNSCLKKQIQPHQAKIIKCKIADLIKDNISIRPKMAKQLKLNEITNKEKKNSYSAYITARKKILARQNPNDLNFNTYGRERDQSMQEIRMQIHHRQEELLKIDSQGPSEEKIQMLQRQVQINNCKEQSMRFDKLVYKPRLQVLKSRREIGLEIGFLPSKLQKPIIPEIKTPFIRKGFVTVVKRVKGQSQLMINNSKINKNRQVVESQPPDKTWWSFFDKFKDHGNITEENIDLFPVIEKINLSKDSQFGRYNPEDFNSKSISIFHYEGGILSNIFGHNQRQKLQIASITKVMTCYLILNLTDKFEIDIKKQKIMVSQRASKMPGTSARLCYADTCSVYDMLHGMMLPSGNDAATALGQWGGKTIRKYIGLLRRLNSQQIESNNSKSINFLATLGKKKSNIKLFVYHMNRLAKHTRLNHTYFVNTHGLMNQKAHSCSYDVATLTYHAMNNPIFKEIVGKRLYKCKLFNRTFSHSKETTWENTNKLLGMDGFLGVKTGITPAAGPCLTSFFQISIDQYLIISILKTKSCQMRFKETLNLLKATIVNLRDCSGKSQDYTTILQNIEDYDKLDSKEDDLEYLNDCQESTTSHSDKQDDDNMEL